MQEQDYWTMKRVDAFWSEMAKHPDMYFGKKFGGNLVAWLSGYLVCGERVLNYGAGLGFLEPHLIQKGYLVTSTDLNIPSLSACQEYVKRTTQNKVAEESFSGGFQGAYAVAELLEKKVTFKAVILSEVIEHLDDASLSSVLSNIHALLEPGGIFFVTTVHDEDLSVNMVYCPDCGEWFNRWQHVQSWTPKSITVCLENYGFKVIKSEACDFAYIGIKGIIVSGLRLLKKLILNVGQTPHLRVVAIK